MARGASARQDGAATDPARPPGRGSGATEPAAVASVVPALAVPRPRRLKLAELFRLMADSAPAMVWVADPQQKCTYVNRPWLAFTGRAFRDELGTGWQKPIHVEDRPAVAASVHAAFAERRDFEIEFRLRRSDGEYRQVMLKGSPIRGPGDLFLGYVGSCVDITERRRAEEATRVRERDFQRLADSLPDVILRIDADHRIAYANPAAEPVLGHRPDAMIGRRRSTVRMPGEIATPLWEAVRATFREGREHRFRFDRGDGDKARHFAGRVMPEPAEEGKAPTALVVIYDVTVRTQQDRQRSALLAREQMARAHAEIATLARDQFLAIVSHELRSPLNGIISWAHVLEHQLADGTPAMKRALDGIKIGVAQQVRLIEDLLDATRVMSGNLGLAKSPMAVRPAVEAAIEGLRAVAAEKGIEIVTGIALGDEQVDGDPDRIQQIVRNLLQNAIKFTRTTVWVTAAVQESTVSITVQDDGVGIAPEFLPFLFDPFRQAGGQGSIRGQEGLGLGLTLVQRVAELHGGHVVAESGGENQGATFRVFLPRRHESAPRTVIGRPDAGLTGSTPPSLAGVRVLLVDDQKEAREAVAELLTQAGADVVTAASGPEAGEWLEKTSPRDWPDALVCDIAMPGEDGYATLKRIRGIEAKLRKRGAPRLPAIALTAFTERKDRVRALAEGFQMHVTKPVAPVELIVVVSSVARGMQV